MGQRLFGPPSLSQQQHDGEQSEADVQKVKKGHDLDRLHPGCKQPVMRLGSVRLVERHPAADAGDDDAQVVENRHAERQDRDEQRQQRRLLERAVKRDDAEHEAEVGRARISHEHLGRWTVEDEIAGRDADGDDGHHGGACWLMTSATTSSPSSLVPPSSAVISGSAGRYISSEKGPIAVSDPSIIASPQRRGAAEPAPVSGRPACAASSRLPEGSWPGCGWASVVVDKMHPPWIPPQLPGSRRMRATLPAGRIDRIHLSYPKSSLPPTSLFFPLPDAVCSFSRLRRMPLHSLLPAEEGFLAIKPGKTNLLGCLEKAGDRSQVNGFVDQGEIEQFSRRVEAERSHDEWRIQLLLQHRARQLGQTVQLRPQHPDELLLRRRRHLPVRGLRTGGEQGSVRVRNGGGEPEAHRCIPVEPVDDVADIPTDRIVEACRLAVEQGFVDGLNVADRDLTKHLAGVKNGLGHDSFPPWDRLGFVEPLSWLYCSLASLGEPSHVSDAIDRFY
ncbi:hypothetical protein BN871_DM_00040 [Paenibacillus sp. P22]|nr:hypothetical protein BN871_DM_00040 [Paenibacillus sp. P22]